MKAPFEGALAGTAWRARGALPRLVLSSAALLAGLALGCSSDAPSPDTGPSCDGAGGASGASPGTSSDAADAAGAAGAADIAAGTSGTDAAGGAPTTNGCPPSTGAGAGGSAEAGSSGASESAGAGGTAGGTSTPMWTINAGKYQLSLGSTFLEIDPTNGARITALRVG
ncbi:MAG: hypothetical protein ABJB12_17440, partial [Pseudomonadota bacterium]